MYSLYTAVLRAVPPCTREKITIFRGALKLATMVGLGFYAITSYALALSEAELKSHLNQQFDVRIGLLTDQVTELDDLNVSLRYSAKNNVSRYQLKYEIVKGDGGNFLKITTHDVIREPIVAFTLDLGWSDGHVVREYSFLIDPP